MRATILPWANKLTNAHRAAVSMIRGVLWPEYCLCGVYYPII